MPDQYINSKVYLAGHLGMVGSALFRILKESGYGNVIYPGDFNLDLRNQAHTFKYMEENKPEVVLLIAGKVGGIKANIDYPGEFLYDNLAITSNVIEAARINHVKKLIFLGSSCVYPRLAEQPMVEESLLTGPFEPTNEAYAIGKVTGLKLCQYYRKQYGCNFVSIMPPNLYGPGDHFDSDNSHVISALISKFHSAKVNNQPRISIWGTGLARREFMYVDDLCKGILFALENYDRDGFINLGTGIDYSIQELCTVISDTIGYHGKIEWDASHPDGMPRKLMDSSKAKSLGWRAETELIEGIARTYQYYQKSLAES
jgi:GDP-L-fucose synthase